MMSGIHWAKLLAFRVVEKPLTFRAVQKPAVFCFWVTVLLSFNLQAGVNVYEFETTEQSDQFYSR